MAGELEAAMTPPVNAGPWLRPSRRPPAEPRWGHRDGLQVGLAPLGGPRGLLRIYAPYLGHARDRPVNFVAVEPVVAGQAVRGYSELEHSCLDDDQGKRMWAADGPLAEPQPPTDPGAAVVDDAGGVERQTVFVMCERFDSDAHVYVRIRFRADRPHEVELAAFCHPDSSPLDRCILTATMGNFARLRTLHLREGSITPAEIWPGFTGPEFTEHARFGLDRLEREKDGTAVVWAEPDEPNHEAAPYTPGTAQHWRYHGRRARQTWVAHDPHPHLEALVNARAHYWASTSPIPGGPSFENFELTEPFRQGRELTFQVTPMDERS
jgi:hypothetical protein